MPEPEKRGNEGDPNTDGSVRPAVVREGEFLELLAAGADAAAFDELIRRAEDSAVDPERRDELARYRALALRTRAVLERHERRESELSVLFDTAQDLTRIRDVDRLLRAVVRRARRILATDVAYIALIDRDRQDTYMKVTDGMASSPIRTTRLPIGVGLGGLVAQSGVPYATSNFWEDERFSHTESVDNAVRSERIVSIVGAPLSVDSDVIGVLYAADRHPREFQAEDIALLSSLAALSAVALDAANAYEDAQRTAAQLAALHSVADERARTLESISAAHRRLALTLLEGGSVGDVATVLSELLGADLVVRDEHDALLWSSSTAPRFRDGAADGTLVDELGRTWTAVTVSGQGAPLVQVLVGRTELDAFEQGVLERGSTAMALVLVLGRIALDEEARSREELLVDLLTGVPMDCVAARRRADRSGLAWGAANIVLAVRTVNTERRRIRAEAGRWLPGGSGIAEYQQSTVVVVQGDNAGRAAKALAERLKESGVSAAVGGAGPIADFGQLRKSYAEADHCAELLESFGRSGGAELSDLGLFGVLGAPEAVARAATFVQQTLAPILDYDAAHDGHLVETLLAYFTAERSRARAAAVLHVHVNTVGSRLARVGALLGDGWSEGSRLLGLRMALELLPLTALSNRVDAE